jgi:hypothetical protein
MERSDAITKTADSLIPHSLVIEPSTVLEQY